MMKINQSKSASQQRGMSLPVAMILLVPLTLLSVTLANRSHLEELMAASQRDSQQSLMNAESGLAMGQQVLGQVVNVEYEYTINEILNPDNQNGEVIYDGSALTGYSLTEGIVTVEVRDNYEENEDPQNYYVDTDKRVILRSTGRYNSGERVVEVIVSIDLAASPDASSNPPLTIFTEEYIKINGNPNFFGPDSLVHSNAYVDIDGTTRISGVMEQVEGGTGDSYQQAEGGVWGFWNSTNVTTSAQRVQTPYIFPPIYKGMATRYMEADCDIWDGAPGYTNPLTGAPSQKIGYGKDGFDHDNWICDHDGSKNKKWELKGDVTPGFYYIEGNLYVPGDLGTADNPQVISLVAEGFLEISGNPYIVPYYDTQVSSVDQLSAASLDEMASIDPGLTYNDVLALDAMFLNDEILLLAGGDLNIQGSPDSANFNFNGVMAAHDQFTISGDPRLSGAIIAENAKYTDKSFFFDNIDSGVWNTDHVTMNEISGNPDIYGNADLGGADDGVPADPGYANFLGWREVIE